MSEPLSSTDPSKKALFTPYSPPQPSKEKANSEPAVNLEYVPTGPAAASFKPPAAPLTSTDPAVWPQDVLERNYAAMRAQFTKSPGSITPADRAQFARMEAVLHERQGTAAEKPKAKTAVATLADSGTTLAAGIAKAHMTTAEVEKYVAEYTAYVASRKSEPKYAALHADALIAGPRAIEEHRRIDHEKSVAGLRVSVSDLVMQGKIDALKVPVPLGLQPTMGVSAVSIPVAEVVSEAMALAPVAGQLFSALEVATGKSLGGLGVDIPTSERVFQAVMLLAPHAAKLVASGSKGAPVVLELARRTGKTPDEVISLVSKAATLKNDAALINDACARIAAGKPLSAAHHAALDHAEKVLGFPINRKYVPKVVGTTALAAGKGETDKYGNVWYSTLGSKTDQALAKSHELVHSALSPKTLNLLREIRADVRMSAYAKSSTVRYLEEAAAELRARVTVQGLNPHSVITGVHFPIKEGYVKFLPGKVSVTEGTEKFAIGIGAELVLGTITYGGVVYTAVMVEEKTVTAFEDAVNEANAKKGAKP